LGMMTRVFVLTNQKGGQIDIGHQSPPMMRLQAPPPQWFLPYRLTDPAD
jgi:hypothetical protein